MILARDFDTLADPIKHLHASAKSTQLKIAEISRNSSPLEFLYRLKFEGVGHDPLHAERSLNLIEQLNQTVTYLASFNAAKFLFNRNPALASLKLNLGTKTGWDIETEDDGGLVAEVFASVAPDNNQKLSKDTERVTSAPDKKHRYVFFMCPGCPEGQYRITGNVIVWSLGSTL